MNIYLHKIKHKLWESYKYNPPISYKKIRFFSKIEHSFNKIYKTNKDKIIEFEQILLLAGTSLNYDYMIEERFNLIERLKNDDIKILIAPTDLSKKNASYYLNNNKILLHKIRVVYPSINLNRFNKSKKKGPISKMKLRLLFIGQKFYGKGVPICFQIANELNKQKIDFEFKLVCRDIPKNQNLPDNVEIIDTKISEDMKYDLYNWCHLFIFPVVQDSFGVYLECLETKTPIISTNIYDKSDIIKDNITGKLFTTPLQLYEYNNFGKNWKNWNEFQNIFKQKFSEGVFEELVNKFLNSILYFVNNPKNYEIMTNNIHNDTLKRFHPDIKRNQLLKIYKELI